jgi:UDP-glucuronate decarboxylase
VALDNLFTGNKSNIYELDSNPRFTFVLRDVTERFRGQFDEIFNLACPASPVHYQRNPVETVRTSFLGSLQVLNLALKTKARVLHASTSEVYGDPLEHPQTETYWGNVNPVGVRSCYDEGKRCAETLCADYQREYGVDVRLVRIFNTYGPNMHPADGRVVSNFIMQALRNEDITIYGEGRQTRSFQYVDDLVAGMTACMALDRDQLEARAVERGLEIPVVNLGNPAETTIVELAQLVLELIPASSSKLVYRELPRDDPMQRRPDIDFARRLLDWEPRVPLRSGLEQTIAYFRQLAP